MGYSSWGRKESDMTERLHNSQQYTEIKASESKSHSVVPDSLRPHGLYSPWNSLDENTGMGSLSLLQGIFRTQGSNPCLSHSLLAESQGKSKNTGMGSLSLLQMFSKPRN